MYSKKDAHQNCPLCQTPKSQNKEWPVLNLASKFATLIAGENTRERLKYRYENYPRETVLENDASPNKVYNDVFDSATYARLLREKEVDNEFDIYFNLNIDGFTSKCSSARLTIIHAVVLNYSPTEVSFSKTPFFNS